MIQTRARWMRLVAALVALFMLAAACGGDDDTGTPDDGTTTSTTEGAGGEDDNGDDPADDEEPQYGGHVVMALEAETEGFIPGLQATGTSNVSVDAAIFDALVVINADDEFEPWLAESIEPNDDLTEWTVTLRSGIEFHDGTPLDAEAMLWNFENLHQGDESLTAGAFATAGVTGMEVTGDLTFVYNLSDPNAAFPDLLAGRGGMPISPTAFQEMDFDEFSAAPVGTGPFIVESWARDDRMRLTRNDNYWMTDANGNALPYLDSIEFRPITDEDSRISAWLADDVQILQTNRGLSGKRIVEEAENGAFEANPVMGNIAGASIWNVVKPPFDDIRVREALVLAAGADDVAAAQGYDGITQPASQFVNADSPWYSSEAEAAYAGGADADLDAATALLQEYIDDPERSDGKAPGERVSFRYQCPGDPALVDMAQVLQALWSEIGVDVELVQVEQATLIQNVIGVTSGFIGDYEASCWRVGTNDDPLLYVSNYFGPVESTVTNFGNWTHPEIDEQLEILKTSPDFGDRYAALERINVIANEESITGWHISYVTTTGWRDDLRGVDSWHTPQGNAGRVNVAGRVMPHFLWYAS